MGRGIWIVGGCMAVFIVLMVIEYAVSRPHQRLYPESYGVDARLREAMDRVRAESAELRRPVTGVPKVVVGSTEHDFGVMQPGTEGEFFFEAANQGTGDLILTDAGKTCKCVGFEVSDRRIAPGESARVRVAWDTGLPTQEFRHGASLGTNDPAVPLLRFRVHGQVLTQIGALQDPLSFSTLRPRSRHTIETIVYSEVWDAFRLQDVTASHPGFEIEVEPLQDVSRLPIRARAGYVLRVTCPDDLPGGTFREFVRMTAIPTEGGVDGEPVEWELSVDGYVSKALTITGPGMGSDGTVDLGVVRALEGTDVAMIVRINDELTALDVREVQVEPAFLQATFEPMNAERGLYRLRLKVPPLGPAGAWTKDDKGSVRLEFDHPRVTDLTLGVSFVVLPATGS